MKKLDIKTGSRIDIDEPHYTLEIVTTDKAHPVWMWDAKENYPISKKESLSLLCTALNHACEINKCLFGGLANANPKSLSETLTHIDYMHELEFKALKDIITGDNFDFVTVLGSSDDFVIGYRLTYTAKSGEKYNTSCSHTSNLQENYF